MSTSTITDVRWWWRLSLMTEVERSIRVLLERARRAGLAPGLIARWGRVGEPPHEVTVGDASVIPVSETVDAATRFDLASLTKPLAIATLTLQSARRGELVLDTRVDDVLPAFRGAASGAATVGHLLTHTSGLPAWAPLYCLTDGDRSRLTEVLAGLEPERAPGTAVVYSCPGFIVLGSMLEATAGCRLDQLFERDIARPLGIEREIGFAPPLPPVPCAAGARWPVVEERMAAAAGHDPRCVPAIEPGAPDDGNARFLGGVAGNAGLFGTAAAVMRVAAAFLGGGDGLLTAEEIELATRNHTPGLEQHRGLGWQLATTPGCSAGSVLRERSFGHTGYSGTSVWVDPRRRMVCVLLTNRNHPWQREQDLHPLRRRYHDLACGQA
jgi:CubicO group peptidase (beta-lactamase class C family)